MSSLHIKGENLIRIDDRIIADRPIKLTQNDGKYQIEGKSSNHIITSNNSQISVGDIISVSNGGNSISQIDGITYISQQGPIYINGKLYNPNSKNNDDTIKEDLAYKKEWYLDPDILFKEISIQGSANVHVSKGRVYNNFSGTVNGSGTLCLSSYEFDCLNLSIKGSGEIRGINNTSSNILNMNIVGSGDISNFICKKSGSANICGS